MHVQVRKEDNHIVAYGHFTAPHEDAGVEIVHVPDENRALFNESGDKYFIDRVEFPDPTDAEAPPIVTGRVEVRSLNDEQRADLAAQRIAQISRQQADAQLAVAAAKHPDPVVQALARRAGIIPY